MTNDKTDEYNSNLYVKNYDGIKIDIIIPCFNAHKTIINTLGSILSQVIRYDIDVTIVNDGSTNDYQDIINNFKSYINIQEIKLNTNQGPGSARRIGYENTNNPLVVWIDADDTLANAYALKILRNELLNEPYNVICSGVFLEESYDDNFQMIPHTQDMTWMFGKIYKREFLDKYNIKMNDTRANEDFGFNKLCVLCSSKEEKVKFIEDTIYIWHNTPDSITTSNNSQYKYNQCFTGFVQNAIWALQEAEKRVPSNSKIFFDKIEIMLLIYIYYCKIEALNPKFINQSLQSCLDYFINIYEKIQHKISNSLLNTIYIKVMHDAYIRGDLENIIPSMSIQEFLTKLKAESIQKAIKYNKKTPLIIEGDEH